MKFLIILRLVKQSQPRLSPLGLSFGHKDCHVSVDDLLRLEEVVERQGLIGLYLGFSEGRGLLHHFFGFMGGKRAHFLHLLGIALLLEFDKLLEPFDIVILRQLVMINGHLQLEQVHPELRLDRIADTR